VRSTDHEAPHYEVFSTPLLPRPTQCTYTIYICILYYLSPTCFGSHCAIFTEKFITSQNHLLFVKLLRRLSYSACNMSCGFFSKTVDSY
jgi:hypothetical protein